MRSTAPTLIADRYEVGVLLGRGGMAEVYAGTDRRLNRPVAIKLLQESMAARADVRVRFEAEARAAAAITQPHAVAVYDSGEHEGVPYIVMERLPGDTLADRIATGPVLTASEARTFGRQVLGALEAAHAVGMVHRDVKPGNILLTREGSAKIADFGIAKSLDVGADLTGTGQLIGTPAYLAPEQLAGDRASPLSDLYALGVVLYEALTGHKPFDGGSAMATARAIVAGDHVPLSTVRPDLDPDLVRTVERAIDPDPQSRFPSAGAMGVALAPPSVPTVVPSPAGGVGPDRTEVLDVAELAAQTASAATAVDASPLDAGQPSDVTVPDARPAPAPAPAATPPVLRGPLAPPLSGPASSGPASSGPASSGPPLAGRPQPSKGVRLGLVALAAVAVLFLLFQLLPSGDDTTQTEAGGPSTTAQATVPTTTPRTTAAPTAGGQLAADLRARADRMGAEDGAAAATLAARLQALADQVERGDLAAAVSATALIVDTAVWRQAGQLTDTATVTVIQLLQRVSATLGGATPAATATPPTAPVVAPTNPPKGRDKNDNGRGNDDDDD